MQGIAQGHRAGEVAVGSMFEAHSALFRCRACPVVEEGAATWQDVEMWQGRDWNPAPLTLLPMTLSLAVVAHSGTSGKLLSPRGAARAGSPGVHPQLCVCLSGLVAVCSVCTKPLILRLKTVAEGLL